MLESPGCKPLPLRTALGRSPLAYDLRPATKEQVQSLGGRFVELPIEAEPEDSWPFTNVGHCVLGGENLLSREWCQHVPKHENFNN